MSRRVEIIMRSKNSDWVIEQALTGLFSQDFRDFELLVVDSGSTDRTLEIVRRFPCRLIEIEAKQYYPGTVLNDAIAKTTSDIVVFQNSDVVPLEPQSLGRLLQPLFDDPGIDATFARQLPRPEAHTWVRRDYDVAFPPEGNAPDWMYYSLPLAAMRRSAWEAHRFYEDAWGSEDSEWGHWARTHGRQVRYVADARVMHSHNYTLKQLYGRRFIEGEADAYILRDHDSPLRMCGRVLRSLAHDVVHHARGRDAVGLALAPARRAVYHWAYLKGHSHGESRIARDDRDRSVGQRAVLDRYEE